MKTDDIILLLPAVYQRALAPGSPLRAVLSVMQGLHEPVEASLATLDADFDPLRAPPAFLPFLARWLDLTRLFDDPDRGSDAERRSIQRRRMASVGDGPLRTLIAAGAELSRRRGTPAGLIRCLELATGVRGFRLDEGPADALGRPRPFHFRVRAPLESRRHQVLIERIITSEKPAHVTHELAFETR